MMAWFRYCDMYSGGYKKTDYDYIFIEAETEDDADELFERRLGVDPYGCACACCGSDFSSYEVDERVVNEASMQDGVLVIKTI